MSALSSIGNKHKDKQETKTLDVFFKISLSLKGLAGLFEIASGTGSLFLTTNAVLRTTQRLVEKALASDPDNLIANFILNTAAHYTPGQTNLILFAYLAGHGVVNVFIVVSLLLKKMWAYPLALIIFGGFVAYEAWQFVQSPTVLFGSFTLFDFILIALISIEYSLVKRRRKGE